jgi:anti-anti-sigma factor
MMATATHPFTVRRDGAVAVIAATALADFSVATQLERTARELLDDGIRGLVVDVNRAHSIDSAVIGVCLYLQPILERRGGGIALVAAGHAVAQAMSSVRLGEFLTVHDDVADAVSAVRRDCAA